MRERCTRQLAATLEVLASSADHPTADQVLARVRRTVPRVSLATVYRNLDKLQAHGRLKVVRLGRGIARYDAMVEEHDHFVCERCGRVIDLAAAAPRRDVGGLESAGFVVRAQSTSVYGLCRRCAARSRGAARGQPRRRRYGDAR